MAFRGEIVLYWRAMALRIAVPNKGRLAENTVELLRRTGLRIVAPESRLIESVGQGRYHILFVRAQDIPRYVEAGSVDIGITGLDIVEEEGAQVHRLLDLDYGHCRLVVACPQASNVDSVDDLPAGARVATPFPNLTARYFKARKREVRIISVTGATEITPYLGVADAIVDLMQTGSTLREHNLRMVDVIMDSWAVVIGNGRRAEDREVRELVDSFKSVIDALRCRYLMANVPSRALSRVTRLVPGLSSPTVMKLAKRGMYAVHAVIDEDRINSIIAELKRLGCSGILIVPIERMVR